MRPIFGVRAIVLCLTISVTACGPPPTADVDAAKASVERAATHRADQYAPEALRVAQDAQAALNGELKAQEGKWVKSYDKTKELAVAAKEAGDKATGDAVVSKRRPRPRREPTQQRLRRRRPGEPCSASVVRSGHRQKSLMSRRYTPPPRCRRMSPERSRSRQRLQKTGKSSTPGSCARSHFLTKPRLMPCGSGCTCRPS